MKSPLKSKPLRNPGESLDALIEDRIFDGALQFWIAALFFWFAALVEWIKWLHDLPPRPWPLTALAFIFTIYAIYRTVRTRKEVRNLRLGRDGEKAVGQYLDLLRESGARIFHDIPADGFNVDHVAIHPTGIYAIETKTRSKPDKGESRLLYDGQTIRRGGLPPDSAPIVQARAAASWLRQLITDSTGKVIPTRPVVVFPGWYIEPTAEAKSSDVWVLNPKALPSFIAHSAIQMSPEDVQLCAFHLGRYIRTCQK
jgi:hypothetical protein